MQKQHGKGHLSSYCSKYVWIFSTTKKIHEKTAWKGSSGLNLYIRYNMPTTTSGMQASIAMAYISIDVGTNMHNVPFNRAKKILQALNTQEYNVIRRKNYSKINNHNLSLLCYIFIDIIVHQT